MQNEFERLGRLVAHYEHELAGGKSIYLDSEDIEDIFNFYIDVHRIPQARQVLELGKRLHPDDELMSLLEVHLLIEQHKPKEALRLLEQLNLTDDSYWHYLQAGAYADLQKWEEAEEAANETYRMTDEKADAAFDLGTLFFEREQFLLAINFFRRIDTAHLDLPLAYRIAESYRALGDFVTALKYIDLLLDKDPYQTEAWLLRASLHMSQNKFQEAIEDFEYLLAIAPENEVYHIGRIRLLNMDERYEDSDRYIEQMENELPHTKGLCQMLRGDIQFEQGNYQQAHTLYKKGYDKDFCLADSSLHYIDCKMKMHKWKGALAIANDMLHYMPDNLELLDRIADCTHETGDMKLLLKTLRKCIKLAPQKPLYLLRYGSVLLDVHEERKAYTVLRKAWRMDPKSPVANLMMAVMCYIRQEPVQMYRYLQNAREAEPEMLQTFLQICPSAKEYVEATDALGKNRDADAQSAKKTRKGKEAIQQSTPSARKKK